MAWTLPDNGVIADDTPDNPVTEDTSMEPEADNPYADYYAYYKQFYGKTDTEASNAEENTQSKTDDESVKSKTDIQSDSVNKIGPKPPSPKKDGDPTTEIIIGPLLPPSHLLEDASHVAEETDVTTRPGLKRKASTEEDTEGTTGNSLDPVTKKQRLKSKAVGAAKKNLSPQVRLSPQAEQALRVGCQLVVYLMCALCALFFGVFAIIIISTVLLFQYDEYCCCSSRYQTWLMSLLAS